MHGEGTMYYPDGNQYDGLWEEGKVQGQGIMVFANGATAFPHYTSSMAALLSTGFL